MLNYPFDQKVHPYLLSPFCYNLVCFCLFSPECSMSLFFKTALKQRGMAKKGKIRPFNGKLVVSMKCQSWEDKMKRQGMRDRDPHCNISQ